MNKGELIDAVAAATDDTKAGAGRAVDAVSVDLHRLAIWPGLQQLERVRSSPGTSSFGSASWQEPHLAAAPHPRSCSPLSEVMTE